MGVADLFGQHKRPSQGQEVTKSKIPPAEGNSCRPGIGTVSAAGGEEKEEAFPFRSSA